MSTYFHSTSGGSDVITRTYTPWHFLDVLHAMCKVAVHLKVSSAESVFSLLRTPVCKKVSCSRRCLQKGYVRLLWLFYNHPTVTWVWKMWHALHRVFVLLERRISPDAMDWQNTKAITQSSTHQICSTRASKRIGIPVNRSKKTMRVWFIVRPFNLPATNCCCQQESFDGECGWYNVLQAQSVNNWMSHRRTAL